MTTLPEDSLTDIQEAFFTAIEHGRSDIIKALMDHAKGKVDIGLLTHKVTGETPLQKAVKLGKIDAVRIFLNAGFPLDVDLNEDELTNDGRKCPRRTDPAKASVYQIASVLDNPNILRVFNQYFIERVASNDIKQVGRFLDAGADVTVDDGEPKHNTVFHYAANCGSTESLELLLQSDRMRPMRSYDSTNSEGATPLHEATRKGHYECAKLLLQEGANASARGTHGVVKQQTPMNLAQSERMKNLLLQFISSDENHKHDDSLHRFSDKSKTLQDTCADLTKTMSTVKLEEKDILIAQLKSTIESLVAEARDIQNYGTEKCVIDYIRKLRKENENLKLKVDDANEQIQMYQTQQVHLKNQIEHLKCGQQQHSNSTEASTSNRDKEHKPLATNFQPYEVDLSTLVQQKNLRVSTIHLDEETVITV